MNMDVGKAIKELLFEHPAVIVPGLGGFTAAPSPSTVDYVQGVVLPPSKKLEFNPNLVINDGILVNHIQRALTVTSREAGEIVATYVEEVKQALEKREIVEVPQVGRLYKDYEHKIRFMPEGENFNAESFGLPAVQFTPLVKERPATTAPPVMATTMPPPPVTPGKNNTTSTAIPGADVPPVSYQGENNWMQRLLPWLVLLAAILLAVSIYFIFGGKDDAEGPVAKERLNVKPQPEDDTDQTTGAGNGTSTELVPDEAPAAAVPPAETNQPPGPQSTYIVVHSFGVRRNATNFAQQLSEAGYAPETRQVGDLYRVGVVIPESAEAKIEAMKNELGKKFKAKPKTEKELDEQMGLQ